MQRGQSSSNYNYYNYEHKHEKYISPSSSSKEDSDSEENINVLLSLDNYGDEDNDDVISTGRTPGSDGCDSPDSICSGYNVVSKPRKKKHSFDEDNGLRKKERVKKMVKTLRGIVPGGQQMDTPTILDEAVRYLKSLKMEVKNLGCRS